MDCWARELGNCAGPVTGEHLVSKCLGDGKMMAIKGLPFCENEYAEISWATATANVLCAKHNAALSPVDSEALKFKGTIDKIETQEHPTRGTGLWKGPETIRICGTRLGQWMVKSWCNQLAASRHPVPPDFVCFAFGHETTEPIHIFFTPELDVPLKTKWGHFAFLELKRGGVGTTVLVDFYGFTWIVSTHNLRDIQKHLMIGDERIIRQNQLLERPNDVDCQVDLPDGTRVTTIRIVFDWPRAQPLM